MIPFDTALLFLGTAFALAMVPGPDNIFVLTHSATHGRVNGLIVTLGLASGLIFHTTAVAFGVAALLQGSQVAFSVLKYLGAAYLLYLAWGAWRTEGEVMTDAPGPDDGAGRSAGRLYLRGLIMNLINPKVTIFFLAFLTPFVDPGLGPVVPQYFQLGGLMMLATVLTFGGIALAAGWLGGYLRATPGAQRWMNRVAAGVFVALAARLALAQR